MRPWTPQDDQRLTELYVAGATLAEVARELDRTMGSVGSRVEVLRASGVDLAQRKPRWTDEQKMELALPYRAGASRSELVAAFGKTAGTIGRQLASLRRAGVDLTRSRVSTRKRGPGRALKDGGNAP